VRRSVSGRHAVQKHCDALGLSISRQDLDQIYRRIVALADAQKHVSEEDLLAITTEVCGRTAVPAGRDASNETAGYGFGV